MNPEQVRAPEGVWTCHTAPADPVFPTDYRMTSTLYPSLGALATDDGVQFRVWAPKFERVELLLAPRAEEWTPAYAEASAASVTAHPVALDPVRFEDAADLHAMNPEGEGFFSCFVPGAAAGARYMYRVNGSLFPDPASRYQPDGVHGPSMVIDPTAFAWTNSEWQGLRRDDLIFYELHVGTFSPEGTFEGVRQRLPYLRDLGITAIELMPLADFPGRWGWGYDPAALFAPCRAYGTPDDLRRLIDEAHGNGMAIFLDVVYNHFGPDGAYASAFAPFFTDKHHTPWGKAINLDDVGSDHVRSFLIENTLHWLLEYRFDGLRLDATHALIDDSTQHFLAQLTEAVKALDGRERYVVAEDERNLKTLIVARGEGGYGLDAVWADDFHHLMRNLTAGDKQSYYADFDPSTTEDVATALRQGWFYTGQDSSFLGHPRGTDPAGIPLDRFIICIQNHDQVGNRAEGNRLTTDVEPAMYRAASAVLLFAPETPLLFMGQEWGSETPFQYFTDHNEELGRLVSEGRKKEFAGFESFGGHVPDPQDPETFYRSKLSWSDLELPPYAMTLRLYQDLLQLRRDLHAGFEADGSIDDGLIVRRGQYTLLAGFREGVTLPVPEDLRVHFHTEESTYARDPKPPQVLDGRVVFTGPAAVVLGP